MTNGALLTSASANSRCCHCACVVPLPPQQCITQVEARAKFRLAALARETGRATWLRPFAVVLALLALFAWLTRREFRAMLKWNKNLM